MSRQLTSVLAITLVIGCIVGCRYLFEPGDPATTQPTTQPTPQPLVADARIQIEATIKTCDLLDKAGLLKLSADQRKLAGEIRAKLPAALDAAEMAVQLNPDVKDPLATVNALREAYVKIRDAGHTE